MNVQTTQHNPALKPPVNGAPAPAPEPKVDETAVLRAKLAELEVKLAAATKKKEVKSNPNTVYKFDRKAKLPATVKPAQAIALASIISGFTVDQMTEPELFQAIEVAKNDGKLSTTQPAANIFRYYKLTLQAAGILI